MANQTQIVNLALSWLGQDLINNLNDNQTEAKVMKANYDLTLEFVLGEHAWTFAIRREILAPLAAPPVFGGRNRFQIPNDVVFVHRVSRPSTTEVQTTDLQNARWEREGNVILAREDQVWAQFIVVNTNTDQYPSGFVHALAARLAADTCMTFTENNKLQEKMEIMYTQKLAEAAVQDGRQGRTEKIRSDILTGVRTR